MSPKERKPRRYGRIIALALAAVLAFGVSRALLLDAQRPAVSPPPAIPSVPAEAAERLAGAIRLPTVSASDAAPSDEARLALGDLAAHLARSFPRVHASLTLEQLGQSLVYTWKGKDPSLPPALLMGHLDVVPVEAGTEGNWQEPPFSGAIKDGFVWGRGALDDKGSVLAQLEAVELLLAEGFVPPQTLLFAFGEDEEVGGQRGAVNIAKTFKDQGIHLAWVLDEGGMVVDGAVPGVEAPIAFIGVAEKGYASFELSVESTGGHSSMPPENTSIGILSEAVTRLEGEPMPARLSGPTMAMLQRLGPDMPFGNKLAIANLEVMESVLLRILAAKPKTNATIRTTTAVTVFQAGTKDNVLPARAKAVVNFRILPGDTVDSVFQHIKRVVGDERIKVSPLGWTKEPSRVSSAETEGFRRIEVAIGQVFPEALATPYLVLGATDARNYEDIADGVYRFAPFHVTTEDLDRVHGTNERVAVSAYEKAVRFYMTLIKG